MGAELMPELLLVLREFFLAFVATMGFGMLFNVPRRTLPACGLTGGLGMVVRLVAVGLGASDVGGAFLGAISVALMGFILARRYRVPRTIFTITGVIAMVPGVLAFTTMLQLATGDFQKAISSGLQTALIIGALAMGLTTIRALSRVSPGASHDE
jgi:uncharacterized membrane protein YjjB (DUF3815 family)